MTARATAPNRSKARAPRKPTAGAPPSQAGRGPARALPNVAPAGDAFEDLAPLEFELDIPFLRAEAAVAAILSDLAEIVTAGAAKEAELVRAFRRKVAALPPRDTYDSSADAALFKIESETVNRNPPEMIAARWARDFSASLKAALAELKSGDPEDAFERLALLLRTILAPTAGASSGLAELARGLQAREALSAGGKARKRRPRRLSEAELEELRGKAIAAKRKDPDLTQEQIAAALELDSKRPVSVSAQHLAALLWARSDRRRS